MPTAFCDSPATKTAQPAIEVFHPLVQHHLAQLREVSTPPAEFRQLIQRLAGFEWEKRVLRQSHSLVGG